MTLPELEGLLKDESNAVEWKAGGDPEKIAKTLAAFANDYEDCGSGTVVCGVEEIDRRDEGIAPVLVGVSPSQSKGLRDRVFNLCKASVEPPIAPRFDAVPVADGKQALVIGSPRVVTSMHLREMSSFAWEIR
jgi:ATP-dependent DNA helicase RecG